MGITAFITHHDCWKHHMGGHHPENPGRLDAIGDQLVACGLDACLLHAEAPLATFKQLTRVHAPSYVETLRRSSPSEGLFALDPDTSMCPDTFKAALRAAGAGVQAVDMLMNKTVLRAFCAVRPPGHHAKRGQAMGFCFFNNIAVAATHALAAHGLTRVAIADFDVHHGNGTEDIFSDNEHVLMVGTFQHPFYPYSGTESPAANMINVPLHAGSRGDIFRQVVNEKWLPKLEKFRPQIIFISAGFDAHVDDDMASLGLVESDYFWVTEQLVRVAEKYSQGRIVSMLEGGYDPSSLARSVVAHLKALAEL